jgi:broad specificity phosphatase PhoE
MILYLIRHGKTDAHLNNKRQSPDTPLGDLGRKQAEALAAKMNLATIDHLYSSEWPRALQTAQLLSQSSSLSIKTHPLVHEIKKHPQLNEISENSDLNLRSIKESRENVDNFDWKFEGQGESLNEVIERAKTVTAYLESEHLNDTVAIVSHGVFIMVMTALILLGTDYDQTSFRKLIRGLKIHNTGVSSFSYNPDSKHWILTCFNDHGHLENEE